MTEYHVCKRLSLKESKNFIGTKNIISDYTSPVCNFAL